MDYGLIGEKLGHSFSKIIHESLFDYKYELKELPKDEFDSFMKKADFKAINVTIPYKEAVIPYLYKKDEMAESIGAVNTIVNKDGRLYGYNTDFLGLKNLILKANIEIKGKKVLILGSGGTSKTAYAVAKNLEAATILKVSRKQGIGDITYLEAQTEHSDAEIIINTTPCGMYPNIAEKAIDIDKFLFLSCVIDVIYNPIHSDLVVAAKQRGVSACGGLYMLISQAAFAAEKFIGKTVAEEKVEEIYRNLLLSKKNIVLIGMPGCGKSTVGKELALRLNKEFIDSDEEIIKKANMPITQIFSEYSEEYFRELESGVLKELSKKQNCVIATGGGAILNKRNIDLLKENGAVVFLDRPIDLLVTTDDRPLSQNKEMLEKRYNERYDIYLERADYRIDASGSIEENVNKVCEVFFNENISY